MFFRRGDKPKNIKISIIGSVILIICFILAFIYGTSDDRAYYFLQGIAVFILSTFFKSIIVRDDF